LREKLCAFAALLCAVVATPLFAASYVVPPDDVFIGKSDSIVVARAITSYTVLEADGNIVTFTDFALGETVKGFAHPTIHLRLPGGMIDGQVKMVSGTPVFTAGDDYLLFLRNLSDGGVGLTDFGLGAFAFGDDFGRAIVSRSAEAFGWDLDGKEHVERPRDATAFIAYIKSVAAGRAPTADYIVTPSASASSFRPVTMSAFTGTSYTFTCGGGGEGCTWSTFPVNFNQGNTESGAPGTPAGKTAIQTAFAAWNGSGAGISYVYSTNNANSNGISDPSDHVNNIVFDKDLTQFAPAYSCSSGGLLGVGGVTSATSVTHLHNGETYWTTTEGDVSMNQGIANCTSLFTSGDFNTAVTHETGHTLGFRHSDQTRADNPGVACSTDPSLNCSSSAVMRAVIPHGLNGALQAYDTAAAQTVYGSGPACTPAAISVQPAGTSINSGQSTSLSVTATGTAPLAYQWYVGSSGDTSTPIGSGTGSSVNVSPTTTTSYWVKVTNSCNATGANSNTATVTVTVTSCTAPAISAQPVGSTITQGQSANMTVGATGTATLTFQWYIGVKSDTSNPVAGQTSATLTVTPTSTTSYWARVTNSCGSADSNAATVTVNVVSCTAPQITTQPTGSTITFGSTAQLTVAASGSATLLYQWYTGAKGNTNSPVFNASTATINVNPQSTTSYWARVTNSCGTADSNAATVTVNCLTPQISATPGSRTITQGSSALFSAIANGGPNMTFQWYQGVAPDTSNPVAGQTGTSINVSPSASTSYWVQATVPGCGTANSNTVSVTVNANNGCPGVTVATPTVTQNGASYTLATTASTGTGGGTVTITWFQQTSNGQVPIGTGPSIVVTPTVTTTYAALATNTCGTNNSAVVTVTISTTGCTAPTVTQPPDETIGLGSSTTITVTASGSGTLHYQWFKGAAGDASVPVGSDAATLITGPLTSNSMFWVKVTNDCASSAGSATVNVNVEPARRRGVRH
jgi:hypothetical protein